MPSAPERVVSEDVSCAPLGSVGLAQPAPTDEGGFPRLLWTYVLRSDPDDAAVLDRWGLTGAPRSLGLIETPEGDVIVSLTPSGTVVVAANGQHRVTWPTSSRTELIPPPAIGMDRVTVREATRVFVREMGPPTTTIAWEREAPGDVSRQASPAVSAAGAMYVVAGEDRVLSFCAADGALRWEVRYDASRELGRRELFVAPDGSVWFTNEGPELYRFSSDGSLLGRGGADLAAREPTPDRPYPRRDGLGYMPGCGFYVRVAHSSTVADYDVELWSDDLERTAVWPVAVDEFDRPVNGAAIPTVECGLVRVTLPAADVRRLEYLETDGSVRWFTTEIDLSRSVLRRFATVDDGVLMFASVSTDIVIVLLDSHGEVVWNVRLAQADLGGFVQAASATLGRSGILYGATDQSVFAIATGVRPAPVLSRNRPSEYEQHQGSNPSRTGSSEAAWFEVAGE